MIIKTILFIAILFCFSSCIVVKNYDKMNLDDADMKLASEKNEKFETTFQVYKEGSAGGNGGKTGGGCGCN